MGVVRRGLIVAVAVLAWYVGHQMNKIPPLPHIEPNPWWGPGEPREQNENVRPFKINISKEDVSDLKARLSLPSRIVSSLENTNFTYGVNSAAMSVILKYWKDNYDWQKREQKLNSFSHFKTRIEGLDIHFMRASPAAGVTKIVRPLLLLHGWPGSIVEFYDIIPLLTTPRQDSEIVFDIICPSLPGHGFSEAASKPGLNTLAMSQVFLKLMRRLGHEEFYAHGGSWGSYIATDMAVAFPRHVLGIHLNLVAVHSFGSSFKVMLGSILPSGFVMEPQFEAKWYPLSKFYGMLLREFSYMHMHATKPDTLGVALGSSPQGLAAYILEKFSSWTCMDNLNKKDGGLLDPDFPIRLDAMLDNICIYWFTNSITTSMRLYAEFFDPNGPTSTLNSIPVKVPAGLAVFRDDLVVVPRTIAAHRYTNIVTYSNPSKGGHFAAMEVPQVMAQDLHHFVNTLEKLKPSAPGGTSGDDSPRTPQGDKKQASSKPKESKQDTDTKKKP